MNSEDNEFIESLNCWEDNYDVITDNIQKLSGMLSLQIQLLQNIQEEKEHERNVRHMTLEEQNISRMLNSFEQRFNVELSKLTDFSNKLDTLLTGQQVLVTRVAQIEEKLVTEEITISSPVSVRKKVYKIRVYGANKVFVGWLDDARVVTLKVPKDKLPQLRNDSCADRPWTYKAEWYVEKDNELVEFIPKVFINEITVERKEPQASPSYYVTGYLTDDGRAVYYDQYL